MTASTLEFVELEQCIQNLTSHVETFAQINFSLSDTDFGEAMKISREIFLNGQFSNPEERRFEFFIARIQERPEILRIALRQSLIYLCAAKHYFGHQSRERAWYCVTRATEIIHTATEVKNTSGNFASRQSRGGNAKAVGERQKKDFAALLIRETAKIRGVLWTNPSEAAATIKDLMAAYIDTHSEYGKKIDVEARVKTWISKDESVRAAFHESSAPSQTGDRKRRSTKKTTTPPDLS